VTFSNARMRGTTRFQTSIIAWPVGSDASPADWLGPARTRRGERDRAASVGGLVRCRPMRLSEKQGEALLESITDIMAYTMERRDEAIQILEAVQVGAALATGMTRERAVQILTESIVFYEQMLRGFSRPEIGEP